MVINEVILCDLVGPCNSVAFKALAPTDGKNVAFSVDLSQLLNFKQTSNLESFSFQATIDVSSINKRDTPATAVVNVGSTIFISTPTTTSTSAAVTSSTTGTTTSAPLVCRLYNRSLCV